MSAGAVSIVASLDHEYPPFERHGEPVSIGVSFPRGAVQRGEAWTLLAPRPRPVAVQTTVLDCWGDGSVRWMLVEFQADAVPGEDSAYTLMPASRPHQADPALSTEQAGDLLAIRTGAAVFAVPRAGSSFLADARVDGVPALGGTAIEAEDAAGRRYQLAIRRTTLERTGLVTTVVRLDGELAGADGEAWLDASVRLQFFAGLGTVRVEGSFTNPRAARHPGGHWDLGDAGSVLIRDLSITMTPKAHASAEAWASLDRNQPMSPAGAVFAVYQDSSGGAHWQHPNHMNRNAQRRSGPRQRLRHAGAWAPLGVGSPQSHAGYETLVNHMVAGGSSFRDRREAVDEFGWRNFGEIHADHEGVGRPGAIVSHYNNQYDAIAGCATRFLQTGDARWWTAMDELAGHVTDVDLYHTTRDRAAYNGGHFWHTQHYAPAGTATHRAYSRRAGASGGGPSAEHNYSTGLLLHHFLTGSERSRAAVIQLADWVMDMDDGSKSRFRWIDRRDTGLASGTRSPDCHGPGRGAGNSINALLDAHRLTSESRYLEKADALLARCAHPDDDPDALDLLDAENRWSYTVFLQAVGKYLEHRADRGLIDEPYAYARAVLRRYGLWMCANERPYLDTPERLEFPTETWAAQDLRKAAVFEFAARHADDERARACFLARADGFVDYAVATLQSSPTGRLCRPLVLLLACGFQRPLLRLPVDGAVALPAPRGERAPFVPLRRRVVRRLVLAGAGVSAAALVVIALLNS